MTSKIATSSGAELNGGYRMLTWNLWSDQPPFRPWSKRRAPIVQMLNSIEAAIWGFQEVNQKRLHDLELAFPDYRWVGLPRDPSAGAEYNPIIYRASQFDLLGHETLWLSPTPSAPGKGWDAAHARVVTMARLRTTAGHPRDFLIMNCHLDHFGRIAKKKSVELLGDILGGLEANLPVVLMGDFNFSPRSPLYHELLLKSHLQDSATDAVTHKTNAEKTWRGVIGSGLGKARLDYLFSRNMSVKNYRVPREKMGAPFPSDHFPVISEFSFLENLSETL
jgi:endonuclease/exonuclease/phosphatase family metal-dependent hydrolase